MLLENLASASSAKSYNKFIELQFPSKPYTYLQQSKFLVNFDMGITPNCHNTILNLLSLCTCGSSSYEFLYSLSKLYPGQIVATNHYISSSLESVASTSTLRDYSKLLDMIEIRGQPNFTSVLYTYYRLFYKAWLSFVFYYLVGLLGYIATLII